MPRNDTRLVRLLLDTPCFRTSNPAAHTQRTKTTSRGATSKCIQSHARFVHDNLRLTPAQPRSIPTTKNSPSLLSSHSYTVKTNYLDSSYGMPPALLPSLLRSSAGGKPGHRHTPSTPPSWHADNCTAVHRADRSACYHVCHATT